MEGSSEKRAAGGEVGLRVDTRELRTVLSNAGGTALLVVVVFPLLIGVFLFNGALVDIVVFAVALDGRLTALGDVMESARADLVLEGGSLAHGSSVAQLL